MLGEVSVDGKLTIQGPEKIPRQLYVLMPVVQCSYCE